MNEYVFARMFACAMLIVGYICKDERDGRFCLMMGGIIGICVIGAMQ